MKNSNFIKGFIIAIIIIMLLAGTVYNNLQFKLQVANLKNEVAETQLKYEDVQDQLKNMEAENITLSDKVKKMENIQEEPVEETVPQKQVKEVKINKTAVAVGGVLTFLGGIAKMVVPVF